MAVPIPEQDELDQSMFDDLLEQILKEVAQKKVTGKHVTPYILQRLHECSLGETVRANIALIKNNLLVGSMLAKGLSSGGS